MPDFGPPPSPQELQFQHAEPVVEAGSPDGATPACVACKQPVGQTYYHAQGQIVCPLCAQRIQSGQQAPPPLSLLRAAFYGGGAGFAGFALYALVAIVLKMEIGLIAILVGWMVGKAIRHASNGMGGRPQQILAVVLTYFAISTSYIPVMIYQYAKDPSMAAQRAAARKQTREGPAATGSPQDQAATGRSSGSMPMTIGALLIALLTLAAIAPFLQLAGGLGGLISLFIIFIGLQRAWILTGRTEILVMGPYQVENPQSETPQ